MTVYLTVIDVEILIVENNNNNAGPSSVIVAL